MVKNLELHFLDDGRILAKVPKSCYKLDSEGNVKFDDNFSDVYFELSFKKLLRMKLYSGDRGESLYIVIKD
jgi:hypothetical protein